MDKQGETPVLKGDNEHAIDSLMAAMKERLKRHVVLEHSPPKDSASNAKVERGTQTLEDQVRTMKIAFEHHLEATVPIEHPAMAYMVPAAAMMVNLLLVGCDGRTPYERLNTGKQVQRTRA